MYNLLSAALIEINSRLHNIKQGGFIKKINLYLSIKPDSLLTIYFKHDPQKNSNNFTGSLISSIPYKIALDMVKPYKEYSEDYPLTREVLLGPNIPFIISYSDMSSKAKPMESCIVTVCLSNHVSNFDLIKIYDNEFAKGMILVG